MHERGGFPRKDTRTSQTAKTAKGMKMQKQIQALHLLLRGEKLLVGWRTMTLSRFEAENVPYIGPDDGDSELSGRGTFGKKEEGIVCRMFSVVLHHDSTM
jgi:hypothetical protein